MEGILEKNFIPEKQKFILISKLNLLKFRKSTTDFLKIFLTFISPSFQKSSLFLKS